MHPSDAPLFPTGPPSPWRTVVRPWSVPVVVLGVLSGFVVVGLEPASPLVPGWTVGTAAVALAVAGVVGHLQVHPWRGPAVAWAAFVVGMSPPLAREDALWLVAALLFSIPAALHLLVVNALVLAARMTVGRLRHRAARHRPRP